MTTCSSSPIVEAKRSRNSCIVSLLECGMTRAKAVVGARRDRREDVGEGEALVAQSRRALPATPPDVARPSLLANARLILEEEADALIFMCTLNFLSGAGALFKGRLCG